MSRTKPSHTSKRARRDHNIAVANGRVLNPNGVNVWSVVMQWMHGVFDAFPSATTESVLMLPIICTFWWMFDWR
jgi:hypothetical protein